MSDLHILAQEILEECEKQRDIPIQGIINYKTQSCNESEKKLVIDAFSELLKEQLGL